MSKAMKQFKERVNETKKSEDNKRITNRLILDSRKNVLTIPYTYYKGKTAVVSGFKRGSNIEEIKDFVLGITFNQSDFERELTFNVGDYADSDIETIRFKGFKDDKLVFEIIN